MIEQIFKSVDTQFLECILLYGSDAELLGNGNVEGDGHATSMREKDKKAKKEYCKAEQTIDKIFDRE